MPTPLTNINLKEWAIAPVKRFSPQAAQQPMDPGDILTLTPGAATYFESATGTTVPVFGGLPTTAELNNAPYYHLIVYAAATTFHPAVEYLTVEISVGGFVYPISPKSPRIAWRVPATGATDVPAAIIYRIPAAATQITLTNVSSGGPANVTYAFAVPQIGLTPDGQQISLISSENWQNTALRVIPGGDFSVANGSTSNLVLPATRVLSGGSQGIPPYYYLCIEGSLDDVATHGAIRAYFNGSTVPCDVFFMANTITPLRPYINVGPAEYVNYSTDAQDNNPVHPQLRQISTAYTTSITLEFLFDTDDATTFTGRYYFVIPYNPA